MRSLLAALLSLSSCWSNSEPPYCGAVSSPAIHQKIVLDARSPSSTTRWLMGADRPLSDWSLSVGGKYWWDASGPGSGPDSDGTKAPHFRASLDADSGLGHDSVVMLFWNPQDLHL